MKTSNIELPSLGCNKKCRKVRVATKFGDFEFFKLKHDKECTKYRSFNEDLLKIKIR